MRYAIIETGGKQFRVSEGESIRVPLIAAAVGEKIEIDHVLFVGGDGESKIGAPSVKGSKVVGEVVTHGRGPKVIVFKFKRRKQYKRKQGHRQAYTTVRIDSITV